jgi:exosortase N
MTIAFSMAQIGRKKLLIAALSCGYAVIGFIGLGNYLQYLSINCLLGVLAMMVTWRSNTNSSSSARFGYSAIIITALYFFIPAKTLLYAAIGSAAFFMVERFFTRVGFIQVVTLICMSPIFEYFTNVFSFPLRLGLTSLAAGIMNFFGEKIQAEGNVLSGSGSEFSVDQVCVGLNMLSASLLAGIILTGIFQQKYARKVSSAAILILLAIVFVLNLVCNLFRIACLVHFRIGPDSPLHALVGMCCFAVYVLLPSMALIRWWILRYGENNQSSASVPVLSVTSMLPHFVLFGCILLSTIIKKELTANAILDDKPMNISGYRSTKLADHITKLENGRALIYIKPIAGFFSSDHQPTMCWTGSGYQFTKVEEKQIGSMKVYYGILQKDKDKLYTAWWYDDGEQATISQFRWRWHAFRGSGKYVLINVSSVTSELLDKEVIRIAALNILKNKNQ